MPRLHATAVIAEDVVFGDDCLADDHATIRERCRIGTRCIISRGVSLHPDCMVGDGSRIMDDTHLATST